MLFVLMVLSLMALSMGTLSWHLAANIAETRRVITTVRTDSGCHSALDVAGRAVVAAITDEPASDPRELTEALCAAGGGCDEVSGVLLPRFIAPPGMALDHFTIAFGAPRARTTRKITDGPFSDRVAVEQVLVVTLTVRDTKTGRFCRATDRFMVPAVPMLAFPLFGTADTTRWSPPLSVRRENDGVPSRIHLNGNVSGTSLSSLDFVMPSAQFGSSEPVPVDLVASTRGSDQVLRPSVQPPTMSAKQDGLPASLRWLVEPPKDSDSFDLRRARLSAIADVVIVDGVWYNNRDKALPWPGVPISSDRPGSGIGHVSAASSVVAAPASVGIGDMGFTAGSFPQLYSWYDRDDASGVIRNDQSAGGVLSYGPLATITTSTTCTTDNDCVASLGNAGECVMTSSTSGTCARVEPGLWPAPSTPCSAPGHPFRAVSECAAATRNTAVVDGSRSGFRDGAAEILPININLRMLQAAILSPTRDELGWALGVPAGGPQRFNGVIYVTSRFTGTSLPTQGGQDAGVGPRPLCSKSTGSGTSFGTCPPAADASVHAPRAQFVTPVGLCGGGTMSSVFGAQACNTASRPNAVRVYGAGRLSATAFPRGLTIATDLPLYVYGDVNRVQVSGGVVEPHTKVALVGDRITFLSRTWRDKDHPWNDTAATSLPATGVMIVEASLVTGLPKRSGDVHDVADVFRALQTFSNNHFVLRGHIAMAFNSEWLEDTSTSDRVNGGLRWLPDYHLENPGFQPPGMPMLSLPPTGRWRQR